MQLQTLRHHSLTQGTHTTRAHRNAAGLMVSLFGPNLKGLLTLPAFLTFLRKVGFEALWV